jgi:hypothetical protein
MKHTEIFYSLCEAHTILCLACDRAGNAADVWWIPFFGRNRWRAYRTALHAMEYLQKQVGEEYSLAVEELCQ